MSGRLALTLRTWQGRFSEAARQFRRPCRLQSFPPAEGSTEGCKSPDTKEGQAAGNDACQHVKQGRQQRLEYAADAGNGPSQSGEMFDQVM